MNLRAQEVRNALLDLKEKEREALADPEGFFLRRGLSKPPEQHEPIITSHFQAARLAVIGEEKQETLDELIGAGVITVEEADPSQAGAA